MIRQRSRRRQRRGEPHTEHGLIVISTKGVSALKTCCWLGKHLDRDIGAVTKQGAFALKYATVEVVVNVVLGVRVRDNPIRELIPALGYLPLWGNSKFYFRVRSLPGVNPTPPFSPVGGWVSSCAVSPLVVFPPCGVWLGLCVGRVDPAR